MLRINSNLGSAFACFALLALVISGCSSLSQLNRRPFMDKIGTLGVSKKKTPKDATGAEETFKKCGKIWFTFWGGPPTFTELVQDMREEGVLSVKDATTDHYSSDGFLYGNSCIAIRGEFYR